MQTRYDHAQLLTALWNLGENVDCRGTPGRNERSGWIGRVGSRLRLFMRAS
jgi:hypothetical protein